MDSTFITEISNKSVGIEIETFTQRGESEILKDFRDNQTKRIIWPLEEEKQMGSNNLWEVKIQKIMDLGIGSFIDINVKSRPLKMCYDAVAFSKLQHFFKIDEVSEEIRAQAYDKYQSLKDKTEVRASYVISFLCHIEFSERVILGATLQTQDQYSLAPARNSFSQYFDRHP